MKKHLTNTAYLIAATALMFSLSPVRAANVNVDVNIGAPPVYVQERVYVQPRPVYVQPQPVYVEPEDQYWKCKKDKCTLKKNKKEKHHKHDDSFRASNKTGMARHPDFTLQICRSDRSSIRQPVLFLGPSGAGCSFARGRRNRLLSCLRKQICARAVLAGAGIDQCNQRSKGRRDCAQ